MQQQVQKLFFHCWYQSEVARRTSWHFLLTFIFPSRKMYLCFLCECSKQTVVKLKTNSRRNVAIVVRPVFLTWYWPDISRKSNVSEKLNKSENYFFYRINVLHFKLWTLLNSSFFLWIFSSLHSKHTVYTIACSSSSNSNWHFIRHIHSHISTAWWNACVQGGGAADWHCRLFFNVMSFINTPFLHTRFSTQ